MHMYEHNMTWIILYKNFSGYKPLIGGKTPITNYNEIIMVMEIKYTIITITLTLPTNTKDKYAIAIVIAEVKSVNSQP